MAFSDIMNAEKSTMSTKVKNNIHCIKEHRSKSCLKTLKKKI